MFQSQTPSDVVFFTFAGGVPPKGQDANAPNDRYRYYEIAKAAYVDGDTIRSSPERSDLVTSPTLPNPQTFTESRFLSYCSQTSPTLITAFPSRFVDDALWANFERWAVEGSRYSPPSESSPLVINPATYAGAPQPGDVRSPAVDVPIDFYANGSGQPTLDPASP